MDPYTEEIRKKIEALPQNVQAYLYSAEMGAALKKIEEKHKLHIDQIGLLETETVAVLIGLSEPNEFIHELADSLSIDEEKARTIAEDVNQEIVFKIREDMKQKSALPQQQAPTSAPAAPQLSTPPQAAPAAPVAPQLPVKAPEIHPAEMMLSQKTVTAAPPQAPQTPAPAPQTSSAPASATPKPLTPPPLDPPAPKPYATDPYREPIDEK